MKTDDQMTAAERALLDAGLALASELEERTDRTDPRDSARADALLVAWARAVLGLRRTPADEAQRLSPKPPRDQGTPNREPDRAHDAYVVLGIDRRTWRVLGAGVFSEPEPTLQGVVPLAIDRFDAETLEDALHEAAQAARTNLAWWIGEFCEWRDGSRPGWYRREAGDAEEAHRPASDNSSGQKPESVRIALVKAHVAEVVVHMVENAMRAQQPMGMDRMDDALRRYYAVERDAERIASADDFLGEADRVWSEALPPLRLAEEKSAAEEALDEIANACGCPEWDYPGQTVRDVTALASRERKMRAILEVPRGRLQAGLTGPILAKIDAALAPDAVGLDVLRPTVALAAARRDRDEALDVIAGLLRLVDRLRNCDFGCFNGDWACAECKPHSDMLKDGFACDYHRARRMASPTDEPADECRDQQCGGGRGAAEVGDA